MAHYQTFQQHNQTDLAGLFVYPADIVPLFIPLLLFILFAIVMMGTYFSQRRLTTKGDFLSSFVTASFFVAVVASVMTLVDGLINLLTLSITYGVFIISVMFLLFSEDKV